MKFAVIGAGPAGHAACKYLKEHSSEKIEIALIEGRKWPDGRIKSRSTEEGLTYELGAEFIDVSNKRLRALAEQYGKTLETVYGRRFNSLPVNVKIDEEFWSSSHITALGLPVTEALRKDREHLWNFPDGQRASELRQESIREYFEKLPLSSIFVRAFELLWYDDNGASIDESPAISLINICANNEVSDNLLERKGYAKFRMTGGLSSLLKAIRQDLNIDFYFNQPVERISLGNHDVIIDFESGSRMRQMKCDAAILTAPPPALANIDLSNILFSPYLKALLDGLSMADHEKIIFQSSSTPAWNEGIFLDAKLGGSSWVSKFSKQLTEDPCIVAFYHRGQAPDTNYLKRTLKKNHPGLEEAELRLLDKSAWRNDRFSGGSYSLFGGNTDISELHKFLRFKSPANKQKNLWLAGEWASPKPQFQGQIEGAVISGEKAARQVLLWNKIFRKRRYRNGH